MRRSRGTHFTAGDYPLATDDKTIHGCDSIYTATVHVVESFYDSTVYEACPNELPYEWHGKLLNEAKVYYDSLISITGCDSIYVLNFSIKPVTVPTTETVTLCQGKSYTWANGNNLVIDGNEPGEYSYYHWYTVPGECDETYNRLDLTVTDPATAIVTDTAICYGKTFDWIVPGCDGVTPDTLMRGLTETTHQVITLTCNDPEHPEKCNPVYELILTVYAENLISEDHYTLCAGESYTWHDQEITAAGNYEAREPDGANGCDKIYRIIVDQLVPEEKSSAMSVCYGEEVFFNNKTYTALSVGQQVLLDTIRADGGTGCDSVYLRLDLTVGNRYYDSVTVTACDKYVWEAVNGNTYTHSDIYRQQYTTVDGCDSIFVLNLIINESYEFNETYDIDSTQLPYTVHEYTFTEGGEFDREFTSIGGCDSIYHITLNVHKEQLPKDTVDVTICSDAAPYNWQGNDYAASGLYSVTEYEDTKEIAIHYLHLTVNDTYSDTTYVHACGSYTWRGDDYTETGVYPVGLTSICGCDSTVVLKLTVDAPSSSTQDVTVCQYELVTVGNQTFVAEETSYAPIVETLTNAKGCDSTITYNVTVSTRTYEDVENASFCEGTEYIWRGKTFTIAGTYYDTTFTAGCATQIYTLNLTAKPQYRIDEDVEVSEQALPYVWFGHKGDTLLSTNGDYYDIYPATEDRCDSVHHIHFHVNFVERDTLHLTGCDSVKWNTTDKWYKTTCLVSDTVFLDDDKTLYDEIHFCDITIHHSFSEAEPAFTICSNEAFTWHGTDSLHGRRLSSGNR